MAEWQQLAFKRIGDDVSGDFAFNDSIADFSDSFATYANLADAQEFWPNTSTKIIVNVSTDVIDWDTTLDGQNNAMDYDLWRFGIFPSDTNWTLRFKIIIETNSGLGSASKPMIVSLNSTDRTVALTGLQDEIGFRTGTNDSFPLGRIFFVLGQGNGFGDQSVLLDQVSTSYPVQHFVEIKRTSADSAEMTLFTDADFTDITQKVRIVGGTLSSTLNTLR